MDGKGGGGGDVSCLSVFGLSLDATEREVHILFSGCQGYIRCIVVPPKDHGKKPYAFVQFDVQENAVAAKESRENTSWEEGSQVINVELSKRNIPESFQPRQQRVESYAPAHDYGKGAGKDYGKGSGKDYGPPAKRQRTEAPIGYHNGGGGYGDSWSTADYSKGGYSSKGSDYGKGGYSGKSGKGYAGKSGKDYSSGGGSAWTNSGGDHATGGGISTLHFTNLPSVSDGEFGEFMAVTFGERVTFSRFVDKGDGRPPVAWVRFADEATAADVLNSHQHFDWLGSQVAVSFARTELDPNKAAGKGKAPR